MDKMLRLMAFAAIVVPLAGCSVAPNERVVDPALSCGDLEELPASNNVHFDALFKKSSASIADLVLAAMDDAPGTPSYTVLDTSYNGKTREGATLTFGGEGSQRYFSYDLPKSQHVTTADAAANRLDGVLAKLGLTHADGAHTSSSATAANVVDTFGPGASAALTQMFNGVGLSHEDWLFPDSYAVSLSFTDGKQGDHFWTPHVRLSVRPVYDFATSGSLSYGQAKGYAASAIKCRLHVEDPADVDTVTVGGLLTGVFDIKGSLAYEVGAGYGGPCEGKVHEAHRWGQTLYVDAFTGAILKAPDPYDRCKDS